MSKKVSIVYTKISNRYGQENKIQYESFGIYREARGVKILSFEDIEIGKNATITLEEGKNIVTIDSENRIVLNKNLETMAKYKTQHGTVIVSYKTIDFKWTNEEIYLEYEILSSGLKIGRYRVTLELLEN